MVLEQALENIQFNSIRLYNVDETDITIQDC